MNSYVKDLWYKNYKGEGDTAELESFLKKLSYGSKDIANYLPWAVVERIFKFQGGTYKILRLTSPDSIVEVDQVKTKVDVDPDTGIVTEKIVKSYFVNVEVQWMGQVHVERYPLQGSNNTPLLSWSQNELNRAVQRAKVKAIANVSGIGYKLFEDGDLQFENDDDGNDRNTKVSESLNKVKEAKSKLKAEKKEEPKKSVEPLNADDSEKCVEPVDAESGNEESDDADFADKDFADAEPEIVEQKLVPFNRAAIENDLKQLYLKGGVNIQNKVKAFLEEKKTLKITELSDKDIQVLYAKMQAEQQT